MNRRILLSFSVAATAFLGGVLLRPHAASAAEVALTVAGDPNPFLASDFPSEGASNRSTTITYQVDPGQTNCRRTAISAPSGVRVTSDKGVAVSDLALASPSTLNEKLTMFVDEGAVGTDSSGFNVTVTCDNYTNSIPVIISRQPSLDVKVDGGTDDKVEAIQVPTSGATTRTVTLSYGRRGLVSGCTRSAVTVPATAEFSGISVNLTADRPIDSVDSESLIFTVNSGALALGDVSIPVYVVCKVGSVQITPTYRKLIVLKSGIENAIQMTAGSSEVVTGGVSRSIPEAGTYTTTLPVEYVLGSGAANCRRLPIADLPSGVQVSSSKYATDDLMMKVRSLDMVSAEDVTVKVAATAVQREVSFSIFVQCDNTTPTVSSFPVILTVPKSSQGASIHATFNGQRSADGALVSPTLLTLPQSGALDRVLQLDWDLPAASASCTVFRENIYTPNGGRSPASAPVRTAYQGTDKYGFLGIAKNAGGMDVDYGIHFDADELVSPKDTFTKMRFSIQCPDTGDYDSVDVSFARTVPVGEVSTVPVCINSVDVRQATPVQKAPVADQFSSAPVSLVVPAEVSRSFGVAIACRATANKNVDLNSIRRDDGTEQIRRLGAMVDSADCDFDATEYTPPQTPIVPDVPEPVPVTPVIATPGCRDNPGGVTSDPVVGTPPPAVPGSTGGWNYSQGSSLW